MEGINKVLAQWIWTVSWKGWELLIFVAHWFKKGQEIATWLQLWGGLSKALCWCKEELKSLRYYTSKRAAWGFRKKKQAKVFASIYSSQAPASQAVVWLRLHHCCQLAEDTTRSAAPLKKDLYIDVHIGGTKALRSKLCVGRTLQMGLNTAGWLLFPSWLSDLIRITGQLEWRLWCSVASHVPTTTLISYSASDCSWRTSHRKCRPPSKRNRVIWKRGHLWSRQA